MGKLFLFLFAAAFALFATSLAAVACLIWRQNLFPLLSFSWLYFKRTTSAHLSDRKSLNDMTEVMRKHLSLR